MDYTKEERIIRWAMQRGLLKFDPRMTAVADSFPGYEGSLYEAIGVEYDKATADGQWSKLQEEWGELVEAIDKQDYSETVDALGDMVVVLTLIAAGMGLSLDRCVGSALEVIEARTGKMVDGVFVKDE